MSSLAVVGDDELRLREFASTSPQPVAVALGRVARARNLPEQLDAAIKAGEVLTRYLAVLALASWAARDPDETIEVSLKEFSGPLSFGNYLRVVQTVARAGARHPLSPYLDPAFKKSKKGADSRGATALVAVLELRNAEGHDLRHIDPAKAEIIKRRSDPVGTLRTAVEFFQGVLQLPLVVIEDQRIQGTAITATCLFLSGEVPPFPEVVHVSAAADAVGVPYLAAPGGLLDLSPGLIWDLVEFHEAYGLFFIDRIDEGLVRYKAIADGSLVDFGPDLLDLVRTRLGGSRHGIEEISHATGSAMSRWWRETHRAPAPEPAAASAQQTEGERSPNTEPLAPDEETAATQESAVPAVQPIGRSESDHPALPSEAPDPAEKADSSVDEPAATEPAPHVPDPADIKDQRLTQQHLVQWFALEDRDITSVAGMLEIPPLWIRKAARAYGLELLLQASAPLGLMADGDLVDRYEAGLDIARIAVELRVSQPVAIGALLRGGAVLTAADSARVGGRQPRVSRTYLRRAYLEEGRTLESIGQEVGLTRERVRQLRNRFGIPKRVEVAEDPGERVSEALLRQLYVVQGLTLPEIATRTGIRRDQVAELAARYELARPRVYERHGLTKELLHELYVEQRKSALTIADELGVPVQAVWTALKKHDIPVRSRADAVGRGLNAILTPDYLQSRLNEGAGPDLIAADHGTTVTTVRKYMAAAGLAPQDVPDPEFDDTLSIDRITEGFLDSTLTLAEFCASEHVPEHEVRLRLQLAGLEMPRRRNTQLDLLPNRVSLREAEASGPPEGFSLDAAELRALYEVQGLSTAQVAAEADATSSEVLAALVAAGIDVRLGMSDVLSEPYLRQRYEVGRAPSPEIARDAGTTSATVIKHLRRYGIEVRGRGGAETRNPGLDQLTESFLRQAYIADGRSTTSIAKELGVEPGQVSTALYRFKIPVRDKAAARVARNPGLAKLTEDYLRTEYCEKGQSARTIASELGVSYSAVRNALIRYGLVSTPRDTD